MKFHLLRQAVIGPEVPMAVFENLYNTRDNDLKVILYALQKGEADPMDIARNLDISLASVQSSLLFWADKGIILMEALHPPYLVLQVLTIRELWDWRLNMILIFRVLKEQFLQ